MKKFECGRLFLSHSPNETLASPTQFVFDSCVCRASIFRFSAEILRNSRPIFLYRIWSVLLTEVIKNVQLVYIFHFCDHLMKLLFMIAKLKFLRCHNKIAISCMPPRVVSEGGLFYVKLNYHFFIYFFRFEWKRRLLGNCTS